MPTMPDDAKGLLLSSIFDENPVVFLEHRWLHGVQGEVPEGDFRVPIGKARLLAEGDDLTIVSMSYMTIEALHALDHMRSRGVSCDLIDLRSIQPIDWETIFASVRRTRRLLVLDTASAMCSVASEIVARVSMELFDRLKQAPVSLAMPDFPSPTSPALSGGYYRRAEDIAAAVGKILDKDMEPGQIAELRKAPHDVPGEWFKGPF